MGVSLIATEESKSKASWEVKITSTVIYRSLCSYSVPAAFVLKKREGECLLREGENGLIEPKYHKEIISSGLVCAAFKQSVEKKSML